MRIEGPKRVTRPIPLTPLVDVVFLLLMFFMLSSTFAKFGIFSLGQAATTPGSTTSSSQAKSIPGIIVDVFHGPDIRVNGQGVTIDNLAQALDAFEARGLDSAIVRVHKDADVQDLVSVLDMARTSRLRALSVVQ